MLLKFLRCADMSNDFEAPLESGEAESEPDGHPSDELIVAKAARRGSKRRHALLDAEDSDIEAPGDAAAAKKVRKAAKRAAKGAAAAAAGRADADVLPSRDRASPSPARASADSHGSPAVAAEAAAAAAAAAAPAAGSKAAKRAAKAKALAEMLSPENAADMRKAATSTSAAAAMPAGANGVSPAAGSALSLAAAAGAAPRKPDTAGLPKDAATSERAYPAFGTTAAAAAAALSAASASGEAAAPLVSNLPGADVPAAREGGGGALLLSQLMQDIHNRPLRSPMPRPAGQPGGSGSDARPGSAASMANLGISQPGGQETASHSGEPSTDCLCCVCCAGNLLCVRCGWSAALVLSQRVHIGGRFSDSCWQILCD